MFSSRLCGFPPGVPQSKTCVLGFNIQFVPSTKCTDEDLDLVLGRHTMVAYCSSEEDGSTNFTSVSLCTCDTRSISSHLFSFNGCLRMTD